jgi:nucleoside-diphosphate-sugar epimerase
MRVLVTGASGLLGAQVLQALRARGHDATPLGRPRFDLERAPDPALFEGADALIHCAYDFSALRPAAIRRVNIEGSLRLFETANHVGLKRLVFVSTIAAFDGCKSLYGQGKLEIEHALTGSGSIIVRPGLIHTDALDRGLVGALSRIRRLPITPMIGNGSYPFFMAHVEDVAGVLADFATDPGAGDTRVVAAAHPRPWPLGELVAELRRRQGLAAVATVPVPAWLVLRGLRALEAAGIQPPFRSDSLVSMLNPDPAPPFADDAALRSRFRAF